MTDLEWALFASSLQVVCVVLQTTASIGDDGDADSDGTDGDDGEGDGGGLPRWLIILLIIIAIILLIVLVIILCVLCFIWSVTAFLPVCLSDTSAWIGRSVASVCLRCNRKMS